MKRTPPPSTSVAPTSPPPPSETPEPPLDDLDEESAVSVAFERVWVRAKTEVAGLGEELRSQYARLDALVIVLALCMIWLASRWHRALVTPPLIATTVHGLTFARTAAWHDVAPMPLQPPRLVRDTPAPSRRGEFPYHVVFTSTLDPTVRMELFVDERPAWSNLAAVLALQRRVRFGTMYHASDSGLRTVAGHDWLRTEYRFGESGTQADAPRLGRALEYATIDREHVYVVTWMGTSAQLARLESLIAPTLRVASHTGMPLLPQIRHILGTEPPPAVVARYPSIVMVVVADVVRGQLRAVGGGSGVIVGDDGSVLTNFHVVHDKGSRLHDLFVIARYVPGRLMPQMACIGRPNRSKLLQDADLALIKCDADLDGRAWWAGQRGEAWPALPANAPELVTELGQSLWVLGYPDVGGGTISINPGAITGYTGEAANEYIKTDAAITQGNSGGPVFNEKGALLGLATAYRTVIASDGVVSETTKVGLVRPIAAALDLLFIAQTGWTPREGRTALSFAPEGVEVPAEGAYLQTTVINKADNRPVGGAIVMVLRPGVTKSSLDMNRLEESITAWGQAGEDGSVVFRQPVPAPGTYSVLVLATGYTPRFTHNEITLPPDAPAAFNPWGTIEIVPFTAASGPQNLRK
ncbi:MAG: trypsin-like peptidase domain-containing protein [Myxococcales bacterium]|nr:trypsin-like peptidase domain-containing protein [Myxococcales bacterium]